MKKARKTVLAQRASLSDEEDLPTILKSCDVGDWFLLSELCKNMDLLHYRKLASKLSNFGKDCDESGDGEAEKLIDGAENYRMESTPGQSEKK